jgi:hypothetical protein
MVQSKPFDGEFDQEKIDRIEMAIERAWEVISYIDRVPETEDDKKLLALCVLTEAKAGQENHIKLVNNAIVRFRAQRARKAVQSRKRTG